MKSKKLSICKSLLWCFIILLFPITSGALAAIFSLDTVAALFLQGSFMAMALIPPIALVLVGKWKWRNIGFCRFNIINSKKVFYFIPILIIFIPTAVKGFCIKSIGYVLGCLYLYLFVAISEEVYFRGIIPRYLEKDYSIKCLMIVSSLIFGFGHIATVFTGSSAFQITLTILNALIFGCLAMEITIISQSIIPAILMHFLFDFETKIAALNGDELLIAEVARGALMFIIGVILYKQVINSYKFMNKLFE